MKKILVVVTNHAQYEKRKRNTGLWLGELVHFIEPIEQAGLAYDIVSPLGGNVPLDPESLKPMVTDKAIRAFYASATKMKLLQNTLRVEDVNINDYSAIYYTGGHGTMWDFPENKPLQEIARSIYENGGYISAVCHGVSALLNIQLSDNTLLIKNTNITGYSDFEEVLAMVSSIVPFSLQKRLKQNGAKYTKAFLPFSSYVVEDKRVITGQNPFSTKAVAYALIHAIKN